MLAVPRIALGIENISRPLQLDFKWADNIQVEGDIDEFTVNGDSAPPGRFNYRYLADPTLVDPNFSGWRTY